MTVYMNTAGSAAIGFNDLWESSSATKYSTSVLLFDMRVVDCVLFERASFRNALMSERTSIPGPQGDRNGSSSCLARLPLLV
jgi:hypothetical protein